MHNSIQFNKPKQKNIHRTKQAIIAKSPSMTLGHETM